MVETQTTWEQETLMLIHDAEEEKLRAEQRVESAKQDVQKCVVGVQALHATLERYRRKYGMPSGSIERSPVLEAEYSTLTPWEMCRRRAQNHDGNINMKELCHDAVAAGMYEGYKQAAGTFYSLVNRKPEVEKRAPGHYFIPQTLPLTNGGDMCLSRPVGRAGTVRQHVARRRTP